MCGSVIPMAQVSRSRRYLMPTCCFTDSMNCHSCVVTDDNTILMLCNTVTDQSRPVLPFHFVKQIDPIQVNRLQVS